MAKSSTERSRLRRERLKAKAESYNCYKSKDRERKRTDRSKQKIQSTEEAARLKKLNRKRVAKCRILKTIKIKTKEHQVIPDSEPHQAYKTPQALGKAVGKVNHLLPKSPRKRKAVIVKLASSTGIPLKKSFSQNGNTSLPTEIVNKVQSFYIMDSITRQSPGKKDFVSKKVNGTKKHLQKRHLMMSLKEAHALYLKDNPTLSIGLTKFMKLRPANVLLTSDLPRNVCLCQYHENIKLLCECISKGVPTFPSYGTTFVDNFVCSSDSEECMLGKCVECPGLGWLDTVVQDTDLLEGEALWYEWERVEVMTESASAKKGSKIKKRVKKMKKIYKEGLISEAITCLKSKLPFFLEHVFVKRQQAKHFEEKIGKLEKEEAVVQVDFAENYTCTFQDEIQAAHWNQDQVTLFTVAIWTASAEGGNHCQSHVIVSDELKHDKKAVAVFMHEVIEKFIMKRHPDVKQVYVFSDGPSSQFKNKYIANFLHVLNEIVPIQWNYFATSHGKGAVDGIGGSIKRLVWNGVNTRKSPAVCDAQSFAELASKLSKSTTVSLITQKQITDISDSLSLEKCFKGAKPIPGISKFHCLEPQEKGYVSCRLYANQKTLENGQAPDVYPFDSGTDSDISYEDSIDIDDQDLTDLTSDKGMEDGQTDEESSDVSDISSNEDDQDFTNLASEIDMENGKIDEESSDGNDDIEFLKQVSPQCSSSANLTVDESSHCNPKLGIPEELSSVFQQSSSFTLPEYVVTQAEAVIHSLISFAGSQLITMKDLQNLIGTSAKVEDKWLTNFVIDEYFTLIKSTCLDKGIGVQTLSWEIFDTGTSSFIAKCLQQDKEFPFAHQDIILIPCNSNQSQHWYLLAVDVRKKFVLALDSKAGNIVKPRVRQAFNKMGAVLNELDPNCNLKEWSFFCNANDDVPQQSNNYDCGIYTCLYARCLAGLGPMVQEACFLQLRQAMLLSLHRGSLHEIPLTTVVLEKYYAVDYINKYYVGRALDISNQLIIKFTFLHQVGAQFYWPRRDDTEDKHVSCIFFGPIELSGTGPFTIPMLHEIEQIFNGTR